METGEVSVSDLYRFDVASGLELGVVETWAVSFSGLARAGVEVVSGSTLHLLGLSLRRQFCVSLDVCCRADNHVGYFRY